MRNISENMSSMPAPNFLALSGVRGLSLHEFLALRQICPRMKVLEHPYAGKWTSGGTNSSSRRVIDTRSRNYLDHPSVPLALSFAKERGSGHDLVVADEEGYIDIHNTVAHESEMIYFREGRNALTHTKRWSAHTNAIFDVCWFKGDAYLLTASGDHTIKIWDVEQRREVGVMKGHTGSVRTLSPNPCNSDIFVSGSRDGRVAFWDIRTPAVHTNRLQVLYRPVTEFRNGHRALSSKFSQRQGYGRSVTAVLYLNDGRVVATAGDSNGVVKFWDTRKLSTPVVQTHLEDHPSRNDIPRHGINGLSQDPSGTRLIAISYDNKISVYDTIRPERGALRIFSGSCGMSFYVKAVFSPDGSHILSGSSDCNAYIWKVNEPESYPTVLEGHVEEVTSVSWSPTDFCKIATASDDHTVRIWTMDQAQFAHRVTKGSHMSFRPFVVAKEPEAPTSPGAPLPSSEWQDKQGEAVAADTKSFEDASRMNGAILGFGASQYLSEVTPPSKRVRVPENPPSGHDLHDEPITDQTESPEMQTDTSPCSVLSPPGSTSRRRKTILDYFGAK